MSNFYIFDLSAAEHKYKYKHLCTPKTRQINMRLGVILDGEGIFNYVNQKMPVKKGDIILIPEKFFCYSEWTGYPDIHVIYVNFRIGPNNSFDGYGLQTVRLDETTQKSLIDGIIKISNLILGNDKNELLAYSEFYLLLNKLLPELSKTRKTYNEELLEAISFINDNWNNDFLFADVAEHCNCCEAKMYNLFKEQLGQTPNNYLNSIKINYAIQYLESGKYSVSDIAKLCNFHSEAYFRKAFKKVVGINPSDYKKRYAKS